MIPSLDARCKKGPLISPQVQWKHTKRWIGHFKDVNRHVSHVSRSADVWLSGMRLKIRKTLKLLCSKLLYSIVSKCDRTFKLSIEIDDSLEVPRTIIIRTKFEECLLSSV